MDFRHSGLLSGPLVANSRTLPVGVGEIQGGRIRENGFSHSQGVIVPAVEPHAAEEARVLVVQGPRTGATLETSGVPGTTPYAQDGAFAHALPAAAAVHLHGVISAVAAAALFRDVVIVTGAVVVIVVVIVIVIVVGLRAQDAVRAFGLRLHFGLQEARINGHTITFYNEEIIARARLPFRLRCAREDGFSSRHGN